jgi:hypothetical protein
MGQVPAKQFSAPTPFGSSPQTNNVTQAQPLQQVSGPGYAPASAFDQTGQNIASPMTQPDTNSTLSALRGNRRTNSGINPFQGMMQQ